MKENTISPTVSVVMPTYNRENLIKQAIKSILTQTYQDFELLIVDDGSTDGTKEIVDGFSSDKIIYIYKEHSGIPDTRNFAIKQARGKFILWMGSDDILLPRALELQTREFERDDSLDVVYGDSMVIDKEGEEKYKISYKDYSSEESLLISELLFHNVLPDEGCMIRKKCYEEVGGYDLFFTKCHDTEFWTRMAKGHRFRHIEILLFKRRIHKGRFSLEPEEMNIRYSEILRRIVKMYTLEELFPGIEWDKIERSTGESIAFYYIATLFLKRDGYQDAIDYFQKSIELRPTLEAQEGIIKAYRDLGKSLADKGEYSKAIYYLNKAKEGLAIFSKSD